ncbi:MAG TPA: hypothetical protein VHO25_21620 [Polyangiaceae bacterium]|nr:hypothetical protein [Polyangiaceae bacterium]
MKRWIRLAAWLIPAVTFVHACGGSATTDSTSGNTNWLKFCDKQADCGEGLSCQCNTCQQTCTDSSDCTLAASGSRCAAPNGAMQCEDAPTGIRLCVKNCDVSADCERDDLVCVSEACVLRGSAAELDDGGGTPDASIASPGSATDASLAPQPSNEAGPSCVSANVELVIPNSGSMRREFEGQDYWTVVRDTLVEPTQGVLPQVQSQVRLGLTLYGNPNGISIVPDVGPDGSIIPNPGWIDGGACPDVVSVPIGEDSYQSIHDALSTAEGDAFGHSPMAEGLTAAIDKLDALQVAGPKVIVLTATGDPDSCADPDSNGQEGPRQAALAIVEAALAKGIVTYVISLDTVQSDGATFMQQLAEAGSLGAEVPFYDATDTAALRAAYGNIFQSLARPCEEQ